MSNTEQAIYEEVKEAEIELSKKYSFPKELSVHKQGDVYLVIYTEGISWIVLESEEELQAFQMLQKGQSIESTLKQVDADAVINVITQIEAKNFEHPVRNENKEKNIYIYLTNNCNEHCRHCYMFAGDIKFRELSSEQWIKILDDFKENGGNGVTFTGGEVTVYKGFEKILEHAHNIGLQVTVLSNGILWNKKLIESLSKCIDEIQISIDGYNKESYYKVRQYDGFDKAIQCVKDFYDSGTKVSIAVTPLFDDLEKFVTEFEPFAQKLIENYPEIFIKLNLELIQGREVKITPEENKQYKKTLRDMVERLYPEFYTETFVLNYENHVLRRNCGFGEISISADGQVYWCNRIHELKSSQNVFEHSFKEIFAESEKIIQNTSVDNTSGCKNCDIRYICGGGCRMEYDGIRNAANHEGEWQYVCEDKDIIYDKMIKSNEFFFE